MKKHIIILIFSLSIFSCNRDENISQSSVKTPQITTELPTNITQSSATCGGTITDDGGLAINSRGVCWSQGNEPTTKDNKSMDGVGTGNFSSCLTGLIPNKIYYVRAYAINEAGTGYGSILPFKTIPSSEGTITDIDGNLYNYISIGSQVWMMENLRTTKYRNGDPISEITQNFEWSNLRTGAYCNYVNSTVNLNLDGRLYNWFAVNDSRKIAPQGWHIPSQEEWGELIRYLGGSQATGGKLKESGTKHWKSPNTGATNETGFTALPAGYRLYNGVFEDSGNYAVYWSSTELGINLAWQQQLEYNQTALSGSSANKAYGFSIRCVKDN